MLAVLERPDALVVGAQEEEVAGLQSDHRAHPRQALFDGVGDVAHGIVVPELAVDPHTYLDLMRVRDFVPGRDAGPDRGEGVKRLAELLARLGGEAARDVAAAHVAKDVPEGAVRADPGGRMANHRHQLGLVMEDVRVLGR